MTAVDGIATDLRTRLQRHLEDWSESTPISAEQILARDERLRANESIVIDLAYEEFCQRRESGESVDRQAFAAGFPGVEKSLARLLELHTFLDHPSRNWDDATKPDWPIVGETVQGFELVEELGRGAFSRVFLAREVELGERTVVVKLSARLGEEASALGRLDHPNIVRIHSARSECGLVVICMPFEGRRTMLDAIEEVSHGATGIARESVITWGVKLARGLAHAHDNGFLHCDVKPSNVLLREDGEPVLLDFNLAREVDGERSVAGGTISYMSPEQIAQILGQDAHIGPAADVYGLAATLFHLLVGSPPFSAGPTASLESALAERGSRALGPPLRARCGSRLATLLSQALAFDPEARPSSGDEFAALLDRCRPRTSIGFRTTSALLTIGVGAVLLTSQFRYGQPDPTSTTTTPAGGSPNQSNPTRVGEPKPATIDYRAVYERAKDLQREQEWAKALDAYGRLLEPSSAELRRNGLEPAIVLNGARLCRLANPTESVDDSLLHRLASAVGDEGEYLGGQTDRFAELMRNLEDPIRANVQSVWLPVRNMVVSGNEDPRTRSALAVLTMLMARTSASNASHEATGLRREAALHARVAMETAPSVDVDRAP